MNEWLKRFLSRWTTKSPKELISESVEKLIDLRPVRGILIGGFFLLLMGVGFQIIRSVIQMQNVKANIKAAADAREGMVITGELFKEFINMENKLMAFSLEIRDPASVAHLRKYRETIEGVYNINKGLINLNLTKLSLIKGENVDEILVPFASAVRQEVDRIGQIRTALWDLEAAERKRKGAAAIQTEAGQQVSAPAPASISEEEKRIFKTIKILREESNTFTLEIASIYLKMRTTWDSQIQAGNDENQQLAVSITIQMALVGALFLMIFLAMLVVIFHDINRSKVLQERLQEEKDSAQSLAEIKQRFLANMSHEIRNPLHAIIGFAEQLSYTELARNQRHLLTPLRRSAKYLLALINDVLDFSKLDSNNLRLDKAGFSLLDVFDEVDSTYHTQAEKKEIGFEARFGETVPAVVIGDSLRLRQMLLNLVGNALKFTETGKVTFSVDLAHKTGTKVFIAFTIADTGIGIPEAQQEEIFSEWTQADTKTTRRYGGTGLGLAITRKLAELHDGQIDINSKEGDGTTVILTIPYELGTVDDLEQNTGNEEAIRASWKGKSVLIADDEPFNRVLMTAMLDRMQIESDSVENGLLAWEKLQSKTYDLVLLDLQMPVMDGFEVARRVRKNLGTSLTLIAVTATATRKEADLARDAGMNDILLKPFEERDLIRMLTKTFLEPAITATPAVPSPEPITEEAVKSMDEYQLAHLKKLVGNNPRALKTLLSVFLSSANANVLGLELALEQEDIVSAAGFAHKLAPACRHLGLQALTQELKEIELQGEKLLQSGTWTEAMKEVITRLKQTVLLVNDDVETLES